VEMRKHMHGFYWGFDPHLACVQLNMGHCGSLD
jgi:hypothetical protein